MSGFTAPAEARGLWRCRLGSRLPLQTSCPLRVQRFPEVHWNKDVKKETNTTTAHYDTEICRLRPHLSGSLGISSSVPSVPPPLVVCLCMDHQEQLGHLYICLRSAQSLLYKKPVDSLLVCAGRCLICSSLISFSSGLLQDSPLTVCSLTPTLPLSSLLSGFIFTSQLIPFDNKLLFNYSSVSVLSQFHKM